MANLAVVGKELRFRGKTYRCAIGKSGFAKEKREGDGKTPLGTFFLRECWYRDDRLPPPHTGLPLTIIHENDGWCDDSKSPYYNHPVKLPSAYLHERLWREDKAYDLIVPVGYNDDPVIAGKGSAIFMHVAHDDWRPTEGCVALAKADLLEILSQVTPKTQIEIREK